MNCAATNLFTHAWLVVVLVVLGLCLVRSVRISHELTLALRNSKVSSVVDRWVASGRVKQAALDVIEQHGLLSVMTPGMVDGLCSALEASIRAESLRECHEV